jgi:hypothetical protein
MGLNYLAPAPYASFVTRNGAFQADVNGLISNVPAGVQAIDLVQEGCVPLPFNPSANCRNIIDGGDFSVNPFQRNIPGLASAGVIASPISTTPTYFADRFFAVGTASTAILMAAVADNSVVGFNQSLRLSRQSGAASSAQISFGQVVETMNSLRCQAQTITLSFWARAGLTYSGGALTVQAISGGSVNQSAGLMASAGWTNQTNVILTQQTLSTAMTRYQFTAAAPASTSQLGILLSFTPSGTAGSDDSVYLNGVQLEIGPTASPFEHLEAQVVLEDCQRFAWVTAEPASGVVIGSGQNTGSSSQLFYMASPVQMIKPPAVSVNAGSFKTNQAGSATTTTITPGATHTVNAISINGNSTGTMGQATMLTGGGGSGWIVASADF